MFIILKFVLVIFCAFFAASAFNDRLFHLLEKFQIKFDRTQKGASLWVIFFTLLNLTGYFYVVHLLLFR
jgi:hypothetical protein